MYYFEYCCFIVNFEIEKIAPFTMALKTILGINSIKEVQSLYSDNYKTFLKILKI